MSGPRFCLVPTSRACTSTEDPSSPCHLRCNWSSQSSTAWDSWTGADYSHPPLGPAMQGCLQHLIRTRANGELLVGQSDRQSLLGGPRRLSPDQTLPGSPYDRSLFPGLGTGVGGIGPNTFPHPFEEVVLGGWRDPQTWAEASDRHQFLYTDLRGPPSAPLNKKMARSPLKRTEPEGRNCLT
jgi:hypothetical protein